MTANSPTAPATAPRRARHRALCARQEHGARRRARVQAVVERDAARAEPEGDRGLPRGRRASARTIRTAPRGRCARRSARTFGLDPARIVCGAGSDDLLNLLADAYLADGDEAIYTTHGFLVYPIATLGSGAKPVVADGEELHRRRRRDPRQGERAHQGGVPRQSEQSDRHLRAVRRGEAAAARAAAACAAGARRGLCGIRPAQRLRGRHRAGRDLRQRRDDAHVLEDLRARGAAARLDVRARARRRRDQPHPRAVQRQHAGDDGRRSRRSTTPRMSRRRARTTRNGSPG